MGSSVFKPLGDFERRVRQVRSHLDKLEKLHSKGSLVARDMELAYGSSFVIVISEFESAIERIFMAYVSGSKSLPSSAALRIKPIGNKKIAREVLFQNQPYLTWLPYERTIDRASVYFRKGRPFTDIGALEKGAITESIWIRNAIAHDSQFAKKKFAVGVIGNQKLPKSEQSPAGYLRSVFRRTPRVQRIDNYMNRLTDSLREICRG